MKKDGKQGSVELTDSEKKCILCKKPGANIVAHTAEGKITRWHTTCRKDYLKWLNN